MNKTNLLCIEGVETISEPYKHFQVKKIFNSAAANTILSWLETTNLFIPRKEHFYRSEAFHLSPANIPNNLQQYFNMNNLNQIKELAQEVFDVKFKDKFTVSANKYLTGQGTLIHTDYITPKNRDEFYFTHRFLIYLNREWNEDDGGKLGLFGSASEKDIKKLIKPLHNSGIGFQVSPISYHAVEFVKSGERFSLNFTFISQEE